MTPGIGDLESQELGFDPEEEVEHQPGEFFENLASVIPQEKLLEVSRKLFRLVEGDKESRDKRDEMLAEGLKRTGLGGAAPGGADFDGASRVTHPLMTQATIEFASKSGKELLPPNGPVKMFFANAVPQDIRDQAEFLANHLNVTLIDEIPEFSEVVEQTLSQVPMGGSAYIKVLWNAYDNQPTFQFVSVRDIFIPYNAASFYSARRIAHRIDIPISDYEEKVEDGTYFDPEFVATSGLKNKSRSKEAEDKIEGKQEPSDDLDRDKEVYEVNLVEDFGLPEGYAPYLVTIETDRQKIVSIYRNWEPFDQRRKRLHWLVEFGFIPWEGMYLGFPQLIGGLSAAATGALRALLDSGHINNAPSAVKLKSAVGGQSVNIEVGSITELAGSPGVDDIRKLAMPLPFNPPSSVLLQLLGIVVDAGMGVVRTAEEGLSDLNNNTPVGTSQAIIEQGATVFSSIHARLHRAMKRLISTLSLSYRVFGNEDEQQLFQKIQGVVPVSDPNIFSETQRFAQAQAVISLSESSSGQDIYDRYQVHRNVLSIMKIPNIDVILPPPQEPFSGLAVEENVAVVQGQQIAATPEQDHLSHIIVHAGFLETFGEQDAFCGNIIQLVKNIVDHVMFYYANLMMALVSQVSEIPQEEIKQGDLLNQLNIEIEGVMAAAHPEMMTKTQQVIAPILPILDRAISSFERVSERALPPESRKLLMDSKTQLELVKAQTSDMERRAEVAKMQASISANKAILDATGQQQERELKAEVEYAKITGDAGKLIDGKLTPLSETSPPSDSQLQLASQAMATTGLKAETVDDFRGIEDGQETAS